MSPVAKKINTNKTEPLPDNFLELQSKLFMLRPIHSKKDYTKALKVIRDLTCRKKLTKTQSDYFVSLTNNILAYENKKIKLPKASSIESLDFLLNENVLSMSD